MKQRIANALPALGFSVSVGILATVGALAYRDVAGLIETNRWVEHTHQVIEACNGVLLSLRDAGSVRHAYALTGDAAELLAYRRALAQLEAQRAALPGLVADNPADPMVALTALDVAKRRGDEAAIAPARARLTALARTPGERAHALE